MWKYVIGILVVLIVGITVLIAIGWQKDRPAEELARRWATPPSRFVNMDGMKVHVRDEGPRDDRMPILLIHGTGSNLHTWDDFAKRLASCHRIIRYDRPGFGLTGPMPTADYSMKYNRELAKRILDMVGVKKVIVVGNSSGGEVAWQLAAAYPDTVSKLVLLSPAGYPRTTPLPTGLRIAGTPIIGPILLHLANRSMVGQGVADTYGDPSKVTPEAIDRSYEINLRTGVRDSMVQTLRAIKVYEPSLIPHVQAPTLIMWGTKDSVIPPSDAAHFHSDIKGSTLIMLDGVGHLAQEEDPVGTLAKARDFLEPCPAK